MWQTENVDLPVLAVTFTTPEAQGSLYSCYAHLVSLHYRVQFIGPFNCELFCAIQFRAVNFLLHLHALMTNGVTMAFLKLIL